jgi:hypothetical protein
MNNVSQKVVDVKVNNNGKDEVVKIVVKRPNNVVLSQAQHIGAKVWTDCIRDGIMTKKELEKFMKQQDVWNDDKDVEQQKIVQEIADLEKQLYVGNRKLKTSEGKNIAIQMRIKRNKLRDLIADKLSLEQNTAEAISDNARFDFLVANCTYYENGQKVYKNLEDYKDRADSEIGFSAATALAGLIYSVDRDFEAKLPENKFLKMFNFVNEELTLVNDKGEMVDANGRRIDENGFYIDTDGNRVDKDGNKLDENGNYVPTVEYITDEVDTKEPEAKKSKKAKSSDS